jgi:hypothetical protein
MKKIFFVFCRASVNEHQTQEGFPSSHLPAVFQSGSLLTIVLNGMLPQEADSLCEQFSDKATIIKVDKADAVISTFSAEKHNFDYCLIALPINSCFSHLPLQVVAKNYSVYPPGYLPELNSVMTFDCEQGNMTFPVKIAS